MTIEELTTLENLNTAFYQCSRIYKWKETTQKYRSNLLLNNLKLQNDLRSGNYRIGQTTKFRINERGKIRDIEAPSIRDRIVQKVLCNKILVPELTKPLIYDNYASLKNRGTSFARKRIDVMLRRYINKYGPDGYILQIDIKKYFDSIDHRVLKRMLHKRIKESKEIMNLIDYIVDTSSDGDKGLNLGSEAPQIFAIYYLSYVDTYVKTVKSIKYYGRYMDDMYVISSDKKELKSLLIDIKKELKKLKLRINENKTHISTLKHGFTFMQIKYNVVGTRIIKRPTHGKVVRERRRLKKYKKLYDKSLMTGLHLRNCYKSWRNAMVKDCKNSKKTIYYMDKLFKSLLIKPIVSYKFNRDEIIYFSYMTLYT